jgi:UDP-N-acetylglucosamine 2-epimerase (non-hydrolysing)
VTAGVARLIGTDEAAVFNAAKLLLTDERAYSAMSRAVSPYGDGTAATKIARHIARCFEIPAMRSVA